MLVRYGQNDMNLRSADEIYDLSRFGQTLWLRPSVTILEFLATPARAQIVAPGLREAGRQVRLFLGQAVHHVGRGAALAQLLDHHPHGTVNMREEGLVPRAEVVESRFAIRRDRDTVLGATAVADEAYFAVAALLGERVAFGLPKRLLRL